MACFSELSNEIILIATTFIRPQDINNFLLTSRHTQQVNAASIREHVGLKRKYERIGSCSVHDRFYPAEKMGTWRNLLKDALTLWRRASYMEYLEILQWHTSWINDPKLAPMEILRRKDMLFAANKELFDSAVEESNDIPAGGSTHWTDQPISGCEDQVPRLLFIRLPNISTLHLSVAYWSYIR